MKSVSDERLQALPSSPKRDDRGVRAESVTNQLRSLVKQKRRKRRALTLDPLQHESSKTTPSPDRGESHEHVSVQKQIQGPVSLQWLIDDFVHAAGVGDVNRVDHYIRGGIPIDMKHSVLHQTALHASAALKDDTVTRFLLQAGASVDALTKDRDSALHLAARYHSVSAAKEILRNNADMRIHNKYEMIAAEVATEIHDDAMAQLLEPTPNPPTCVRVTSITSTSLTVTWSSHSQKSSAYEFRVSWMLAGSLGEFFEICPGTSFRINNLMPAAPYEIRVQTGNHTVGWSPSSDVLAVETDGDVPCAMAAPIITRVSDHSITMRIRIPPSNGADVQRVSIQAQCTGSIAAVSTASFRRLLRSADQDQRWESVMCETSLMRNCDDNPYDKEHTVEGLLPGHVYYFRVKASNRFGWSPDGEVSDGICTNDVPKVVTITARSIVLVWTKPYSTELIDKYRVQARVSYSTKWEFVTGCIYDQRAHINDLVPATSYGFRVVPHYASSDEWEDVEACTVTELCTTHTTVPEAPLNLRVIDRTAHSIILSWDTPRCNGHAIEAYRVEHRIQNLHNEYEDWIVTSEEVPVDAKTYEARGLVKGEPYQFRVSGRNARGEGEYALLLDPPVWTYAFVPPTAITCVAKTSFSLTIAWQDGSTDDSEPSSHGLCYEVQILHIDSSLMHSLDLRETISTSDDWVPVVEVTSDRQAVVSGLTPLGCYCFRVRACALPPTTHPLDTGHSSRNLSSDASSVFSPISDVFQTLRRM